MLVLENGIDFEIDKDDGNIKKVEKQNIVRAQYQL